MKETEINFKDEVKLHTEKQQEKKIQFIGSIQPHQGHTCYELNTETGIIEEAKFERVAAVFTDPKYSKDGEKSVEPNRLKLMIRDNCLYTTALNKKNALKKFRKMVGLNNIQK